MSTGSSKEHVLVLLFLYFSKSFIGRAQLSEELGIGEGRVRRILLELSQAGFVEKRRAGVRISPKGREAVERTLLSRGVSSFFLSDAQELNANVAVVAIARAPRTAPLNVLGMRDDAVRGGAQGAVISVYRNGSLELPPTDINLCVYASNLCREITRRKSLSENSLIIAVFAYRLADALSGLLSLLYGKHYSELSQDLTTDGTSETELT
ncbi:DUF4443 domain-containing protein [Infirmifilum sp. NZ]|uniref:DUF4443 domain-containing protein n=1 Tax=Infirmifilum sp. NZ TaxID=2926850 RepID=UPI0027A9BB1F|nr:DUF4443 domain-containing protein [Infirmifilum sp. NZ]UNQ73993.1 DUF4443 domain-containing protein [Infirmifilum sp. NZ]